MQSLLSTVGLDDLGNGLAERAHALLRLDLARGGDLLDGVGEAAQAIVHDAGDAAHGRGEHGVGDDGVLVLEVLHERLLVLGKLFFTC